MKLIDKDKIVTKIEKRYKYWRKKEFNSHNIESEIRMSECQHLMLLLNSIETEEVDLEKEISKYLDNHNLNIQDGGRIIFNNGDTPNLLCDFRDIAKFFFELGLKTKGE